MLPALLHAQATVTPVDEAVEEENVVALPTDKPLIRRAKLKRAWVVFHQVDDDKVYAIKKAGTKHEIQTVKFFSAFNSNYLVKLVKPGRLDNFPTGEPITSIDGLNPSDYRKHAARHRLVKVRNSKAVWLLTPDGKRRVIAAEGVFHRFGWEFRDVEEVTDAELGNYTESDSVTDETVFDEDIDVSATHERRLREDVTSRLKLRAKKETRKRLIKAIGKPDIYILDARGLRHKIRDLASLRRHNLNIDDTTEISTEEIEALPEGDEITTEATSVDLNTVVE
ncbi:hypothetical protein A3D72_03340 [Candidatus Uhrbacteria bacterium RIFCSPHIGHO2_02_FULL_57_19]|nr:MAG: hypothetical protein A3D72_03340 [Candidatus Uhrbacteria bacterium RIFCSPHIGHO2_02_FULL_57_19]